jgi:hypothetical protein
LEHIVIIKFNLVPIKKLISIKLSLEKYQQLEIVLLENQLLFKIIKEKHHLDFLKKLKIKKFYKNLY